MTKRLILADSACDLNDKIKKRLNIELVPFHIDIDGESILDTPEVDRDSFLKQMKNSSKPVGTAAPSPNQFMEKFSDYDEIFIITISKKLSATFNNAVLAKNMFEEKSKAKIHVFDSKSAGSGETVVALKIQDLIEEDKSFEEIVEETEKFISELRTYFILDNFDNLIKNGRMSMITGKIAKFLSFKPVMHGVDGQIEVYAKTRGYIKALRELYSAISTESNLNERNFVITHCEALDVAKKIKSHIDHNFKNKSINVVESGLLTSVYANLGGVIVCF